MKYNELVKALKEKGLLIDFDESNKVFTSVSYDSRKVTTDSIFVCKGLNFKKEYLLDVINKGVKAYISEVDYEVDIPKIIVTDALEAMAIVSEKVYDDKSKNITLIGVTGTKGKTTIVDFIHNILDEEAGRKTAYWATIDHFTGKKHEASHNTTPESVDLYETIKDAKDENLPYFTTEVSSQATKMKRIYGMKFDIGVFINVSYDHISPLEHKDFDEYLNCKIGFLKQCKTVFLYRHIDHYKYIREELKEQKVYTFGNTSDCDYMFSDILRENGCTSFNVTHNNQTKEYKITIAGNFNVINATSAIAVATLLNVKEENILKGLLKTEVIGRMNIYQGPRCPIIVDYAHNKLSIKTLFTYLKKEYPSCNLKVVVGCPGNKAYNRRKEIGTLCNKYASYIYLTSDDPGMENVADICKEIATHITKSKYEIIEDRETAIIKAMKNLQKNDILAIIGKGHEDYNFVENEYLEYKSDVKVVEEVINLITEQ